MVAGAAVLPPSAGPARLTRLSEPDQHAAFGPRLPARSTQSEPPGEHSGWLAGGHDPSRPT